MTFSVYPSFVAQPRFGGEKIPLEDRYPTPRTRRRLAEKKTGIVSSDTLTYPRPAEPYYPLIRREWISRKNKMRMFIGAALLGLGFGTHQLFKADQSPTIANFYTAKGDLANCRLSERLNVICNGIKRGSVDDRGRAYNVLWQVGNVAQDGSLFFSIHNGPTLKIGRVLPDGTVQGPNGENFGKIERNPEAWDAKDVSVNAKGAAAILALRPDANEGVWRMIADIASTLIQILAESENQDD